MIEMDGHQTESGLNANENKPGGEMPMDREELMEQVLMLVLKGEPMSPMTLQRSTRHLRECAACAELFCDLVDLEETVMPEGAAMDELGVHDPLQCLGA